MGIRYQIQYKKSLDRSPRGFLLSFFKSWGDVTPGQALPKQTQRVPWPPTHLSPYLRQPTPPYLPLFAYRTYPTHPSLVPFSYLTLTPSPLTVPRGGRGVTLTTPTNGPGGG